MYILISKKLLHQSIKVFDPKTTSKITSINVIPEKIAIVFPNNFMVLPLS